MSDINATLVVPMDMAALCVGDTDVNGSATNPYGTKDFSRLAPDFSLLPYAENGVAHNRGPYISHQVLADSFQKVSDPLDVGIHLHWALPDAIAHGKQAEKGKSITFPPAPNRWFVVRIATNSANIKTPVTSLKAWVIESDHLWSRDPTTPPDLVQNTKSIDVPLHFNPEVDNNKSTMAVGKAFKFDEWAENNDAKRIPLTALGYGEATYAAAYEFCPNVFGFWDTLDDLDMTQFPPESTRVSYMVTGWYSTDTDDPLAHIKYPDKATNEEKIQVIENVYHWVFNDNDNFTVPTRSLFNSLVTDIPWDKKTHYIDKKLPSSDLQVSIGNTTAEALSALIAAQPEFSSLKNIETILNALQIGVLNRLTLPGGLAEIDEALHQKDFASTSHGSIWEIKPKVDESNNSPFTPAGNTKSSAHNLKCLPQSVAEALNALNIAQQALDQAISNVLSLRQRIYADWVRTMKLEYSSLPPKTIDISPNNARAFIEDEINLLQSKVSELSTLNNAVEQKTSHLKSLLNDDFVLGQNNSSRYWNPSDPVILFSGTDIQPPFRYGSTVGTDDDQNLVCRLDSGLISSMKVVDSSLSIDSKNLPSLELSESFVFKKELQALLAEAFFIDSKQASVLSKAIAELGGDNNPAIKDPKAFIKVIEAAQAKLFSAQVDSDSVIFSGLPPSTVSFKKWQVPWIPIIMQWETTHYPNALPPYGNDFITKNYHLDPDDIDLVFKGSIPVNESYARVYQGTIVLTHNTEVNIKDQIARYIQNFPDSEQKEELQDIYDHLKLSMQAQSLSGFNEAFLMLARVLQMEVADPLGILQGQYFSNFTNVLVKGAVASENDDSPLSNNTFGPIRSGGVKINRLRVIDTFGQALDIEKPKMIRAESFKTPNEQSDLINLPVRYTQPARLLFRWLSAKDNQVEVNSHPASTPVCGWVLFNHLDDSLVIYDEAGQALGSFNVLGPLWLGAPGNQETFNRPIEEVFANVNSHLKNFALGIYTASSPRDYLKAILKTIDESVTFISPQNYKQQSGLSVLIGRPLALVRASLDLDVLGLPAINQSKQSFADSIKHGIDKERDDGAVPHVEMPVRLGELSDIDDGLVGYFIDDGSPKAYQSFYAPAASAQGNNGVIRPKFDQVVVNTDEQTPPVLVSILMDPHASIHATTGMLPMKELLIPPSLIADDLNAMAVTFLTSPVITGDQPHLPTLDESGYSWKWVTLEDDAKKWTIDDINAVGQDTALTMTQQKATEGWLKLQHEPIALSDVEKEK